MAKTIEVWDDQAGQQDKIDQVVGHALVAVRKQANGALTIERWFGVSADNREDNDTVEGFIKSVEKYINEGFPVEPEPETEVKIWLPQ